jgi:hypothetical protein
MAQDKYRSKLTTIFSADVAAYSAEHTRVVDAVQCAAKKQ